jgi:DNA polymerase III delta prime subunit
MAVKKPWVEAYRPNNLGDVIFTDDRTAKTFASFVKNGELPNLLLYGPPGTGKTSVSKALLRDLDVDTMDRLRINCSDEKIDAMREKVRGFAMTMPISSFKVVQLEEFDYLGHDAQALLRSLIEEASGTCRFIATCNYINKITPPLRSRFQEFHFAAPAIDLITIKAAEILENQKVVFDVDALDAVVAAGYPDFRKIIQMLEQHSTSGELVTSSSDKASDWKIGLLPAVDAGDFKAARKLVCESATREELQDVYRFLYDNLHRCKKLKGKEDQAVVLVAQYLYQHAFSADGEINIAALFVELGAL